MVRSELVQALCSKLPELPPHDIKLAVNCMLDYMGEALQSGERIEIRDFGSFNLRQRPPRIARNPKTGEQVALPAQTVVHFKPGRDMRSRVEMLRYQYGITG